MEAALKFAQSRLSPPTLGLHASEAAMDEPLRYLKEVTATYLERRNTLVQALQQVPESMSASLAVRFTAWYNSLLRIPMNLQNGY